MIGDLIKQPDPSDSSPDPDDEREKGDGSLAVNLYKRPWYAAAWFKALLFLLPGFLFVGAVALFLLLRPYYAIARDCDISVIGELEKASVIYDRAGREIDRMYVQNRRPISLDRIPFHLVQAFTATEDSRFFKHKGIDYYGIVRAAIRNYRRTGTRAHGASTITMQLARDAYGLKGGIERKFTEAFLARRIEKQLSKAKILEIYLNRIYFGEGYYGISAAANGYFGKPVTELTIGESAILAGMPKSPNAYSPRRHPERSRERRDYVLGRMAIENFITDVQRDALRATPIQTTARKDDAESSSYVYEQIRQRVVENLGNQRALSGGFHIFTTIDSQLQAATEKAVVERLTTVEKKPGYGHQTYEEFLRLLERYEKRLASGEIHPDTPAPRPSYLQGAALVIENRSGAVRALVGGRNFDHSEYDRALLSKRAVGTAFKPIVYASAFEGGAVYPGTLLKDTPIDNRRVMIGGLTGLLGEWGMEADAGSYYSNKEVTVREALVRSLNAASVRLGEQVGLERLKETAARMGISSPIKDFPASYLGSSEASLAEMTLAYTAFPEGGRRPGSMYFIRKIMDDEQRTIYHKERPEDSAIQVISPTAAYQVHSCLIEVPKQGTAANAGELGLEVAPVACKTGTHYNFKDLWLLGYSSKLTCGVWVGFDQPTTIYDGAFSNALALPVWIDVMNASASGYEPTAFASPTGLRTVEICKRSGHAATDACYEQIKDDQGRKISVRTTFPEVVGDRVRINRFCDVHSGEPLASQVLAAALEPKGGESASLGRGGSYSSNESVRMVSPTVLGIDPYRALRPVLKAIAMLPEESESESGQAGASDDDDEQAADDLPDALEQAVLARPEYSGDPKYQIRLQSPAPVEILD
jgi:penicillin-binding protein 1A